MKFLFLDFDGVLFDTVEEAYQVCINSNKFKDSILPKNSFELFKLYRPLVGPAWNYYYIMHSIINKEKICNSDNFLLTEQVKNFEKDFFSTRKKLKQDYNEWLKLNKKYSFTDKLISLFEENKYLLNNLDIYIITTKDKNSVKDLLQVNNIKFIKHENIYGKEIFNKINSKSEIILNILKTNKKDYNTIFIDDSLFHLMSCENIRNIELMQPKWGYINKKNSSKYLKNEDEVLYRIKKFLQRYK